MLVLVMATGCITPVEREGPLIRGVSAGAHDMKLAPDVHAALVSGDKRRADATLRRLREAVKGGTMRRAEFRLLLQAFNNWQILRQYRGERPLAPGASSRGLALSGGGMRSAMFSMGVLGGLHESGALVGLDYISSVSGGGYTSSWYFAHHARNPMISRAELDKALLHDGSEARNDYQDWIDEHGRILTWPSEAGWVGHWLGGFAGGALSLALGPVKFASNGLFDMRLNMSALRSFYEMGLERAFLTYRGGKLHVKLPELVDVIEKRRLPFPILNATCSLDDDYLTHPHARLRNTVYEFTPRWHGSGAYGYHSPDREIPIPRTRMKWQKAPFPFRGRLAEAMVVSGAAVDSSAAQDYAKSILEVSNLGFGQYVPNPHRNRECGLWGLMPLRGLLAHGRNSKSHRAYLVDGGYAENLGVFSLVRRLCRHIIVVDAEVDPDYRFTAYVLLRKHLMEEMGVRLRVRAIDDLQLDHGALPSDSKAERTRKRNARRRAVAKQPVMEGWIHAFMCLDDTAPRARAVDIKVTYVKLSLPDAAKRVPHLKAYARTHEAFPQQTTADLNYSAEQCRAYRTLGRFITRKHVR